MRTIIWMGIMASAAVLLTACASRQQPAPTISSTQGSTLVRSAQVLEVRDVVTQGNRSTGIGSVVGAVLGGLAGNAVGGGNGSTIAGIGGAVAGGVAGQRVEQAGGTVHASELTVRFDNGDTRTYPIEPGESFHVGDRVTITTGMGGTRITH